MKVDFANSRIVIAGGGGFIGGFLAKELRKYNPLEIRVIDIKPFSEWYQLDDHLNNLNLDLSKIENCEKAVNNSDYVFNLAADMGGMGFIENNKALCMLSVLINTHLLEASKSAKVKKFFFASSACVYRSDLQTESEVIPLSEEDAYPASPEDGYGWEKLFSERMCRHFNEDFGLQITIARFHNVYGPLGTYAGGREKAPAAICRKVAQAKITNSNLIDIWGDGEQTRSFMYIDDCVNVIIKLFMSDFSLPINLGSSEMVTINEMVSIVEEISGIKLNRNYDLSAPKGVRGRNSDNTLIKQILNWEPSITLKEGLSKTYAWIYDQVKSST
jgi:nucleoside-diphosphate-sugar epimerase